VIPGTGIGYIDEIYDSRHPYTFETSFAFYTLDEITGNREDRDKVRAYTISGSIGEIKNWDNFLTKLNVEEANRNRSNYSRQYENRVEVLADQLKFILRTSSPEQYYPYGADRTNKIMNLGQKISWLSNELISRRNFLAAIVDKYGSNDPLFYRDFLISRAPWYWIMGVDRYESLINQSKDLREYEQSAYSQVISRKGNANKYINDEDYLTLVNMMGKVHYYEESLINSEETLNNLKEYRDQIYREIDPTNMTLGEAISKGFLKYLQSDGRSLVDIRQEMVTQEISNYIMTDLLGALEKAVDYEKLLLNIEYLPVYEAQIVGSYEFSKQDMESAEKIYNFVLNNYGELLNRENWQNYMDSVNKEFQSLMEQNPEIPVPDPNVQVLSNFRIYGYYLKNIEPELKRNQISGSHYLYPFMAVLKNYGQMIISEKSEVRQMLSQWLQSEDSLFIKGAVSLISYQWQKERTAGSMANLEDFRKRELDPYIFFESRNYDIDESERLWNAAIENILSGENLQTQRTFKFHKVTGDETINSISRDYNVNPFDVFYENRYSMEFSSDVSRSEMNSRLEYGDFNQIFSNSRDVKLQQGQDIYIPEKEIYSEEWLDLHQDKQKLRKFYINRYIYSNIETMAEDAFYSFVNETEYISQLEQEFGVTFNQLDLNIEDRIFFSNPRTGEIDNDFIDLYFRKAYD